MRRPVPVDVACPAKPNREPTNAASPSEPTTTNTPRQPIQSATAPASEAPRKFPEMTTARYRPSATCRSVTGTRSPTMAKDTGNTPPAAIPARIREAIRTGKLVAVAPIAAVAMSASKHAVITRVLPNASVSGPRTGWMRANGRANAVYSKATRSGVTPRSAAIAGTIGSTARLNSDVANATVLTPASTRRAFRRASSSGAPRSSFRADCIRIRPAASRSGSGLNDCGPSRAGRTRGAC